MLSAVMAALSLAVVPMVDRCRAVIEDPSFFPETDSAVWLYSADSPEADVSPLALDVPSPPEAKPVDLSLSIGIAPGAELKLDIAYAAVPDGDPKRRLPTVSAPEPRSLATNALDAAAGKIVYEAVSEGSVSARSAEWRMPLVKALSGAVPGAEFDRVYGFLLKGFGGPDERSRVRALAKWAAADLSPREAADVYRAEARYWLNLGDAAMTADAAKRMERARPDYSVRARRLSALAYATAGEFAKAKAEIARSRGECRLSGWERNELLYMEAWIWLQEGDVASARRGLESIVGSDPGGQLARKAQAVLNSISEGGD